MYLKEVDTPEQVKDSLRKAIVEMDRLINEEKKDNVRIVISNHWCSEGIWVETEFKSLSSDDYVVREYKLGMMDFDNTKIILESPDRGILYTIQTNAK